MAGANMKKTLQDFPATLILQRKSITQFPNGQKVILYYNEKIKKFFTVLSDSNAVQFQAEDSVEIEFEDGSSLSLCQESIEKVYMYLDTINSEEKEIVESYIQENADNFLKVLEFFEVLFR